MVLLLHPTEAVVLAQPVSLRDRVAARLRARALDAALARGADPEAGTSLALRARALTSRSRRCSLARGLERVLADSRSVRSLAARLTDPGPVAARGVAEVNLLLTDGGGPLHARRGELDIALARARRHLEL